MGATASTPLAGIAGGAPIGLAAALLMASVGRVMGASGVFGGLPTLGWCVAERWRALLVLGLMGGAWGVEPRCPGPAAAALGGLPVGAGTALAGGCRSGHGICGLARPGRRAPA